MVEIKKHRDQRNNSDNIARRNERDRPDMIHADALGNKATPQMVAVMSSKKLWK